MVQIRMLTILKSNAVFTRNNNANTAINKGDGPRGHVGQPPWALQTAILVPVIVYVSKGGQRTAEREAT